ncbi:SUMO-activating enzyme subunit 2-like isoform X1 [Vespa mandarinia]|uniref:SUMO-activating enzyme subunit 2-like isoform X1 n=1 Tax=Vespa mandarinia TaxID=7446 RepID=UPI0016202CB5|nr:SUMO-activating enzyme subunit 2-like isoform X1 [Vespa mandarinia]
MAANICGVFRENLQNAILKSKVLVVGAGGIGCEILKNLVMTGFSDIEIIDLDTIDVSNLNRQFLFQKKHVGKSKAEVAKETALTFNPNAKIIHYHDSITSSEFGLSFFKKFSLVMNALDNRAARNHVNRMCLAADVPLIESGTAGYEGQVELIKKGLSQCYECTPKAAQKTFPGCTIRNTPSEPIHCIVWAKHLFNQLFGEEDPDQDVSPDTADPEATDTVAQDSLESESNSKGNVDRVSTRSWAQSCNYDSKKLFTKFFYDDIKYLLSMENLWKKRRPPTPLDWSNLPDAVPGSSKEMSEPGLKDQQRWSIAKCGTVFAEAINNLSKSLKSNQETTSDNHLIWDKDDQHAMDFVAACANIRAYIFGIQQKTRFDIKSMAGNIIPAIATTNAIIAGLVVLHAFYILENRLKECRSVYLRLKMNHRNQLLVPEKNVNPPNPKCYVCAPTPQAVLAADTSKMTIRELDELVLKNRLNMIAPDVIIDGKGIVIISSEEGETEENNNKILEEFGIKDGTILKVDDFHQNYSLTITIMHRERPSVKDESPEFLILANEEDLMPKEENNDEKPSTSNGKIDISSEDSIMIVETEVTSALHTDTAKKRKTDMTENDVLIKKRKLDINNGEDVSIIEDDATDLSSERKTSSTKKSRSSTDDDCLIVYDEGTETT